MRNNDLKANVICLSNQLWDYPLWTNKRHVMGRLAQRGFNVVFVDPPINTGRLFLKYLLAGKWSAKRLLSWSYENEDVTIFSPLNFVPANETLTKIFAARISKLAASKFDPKLKTILWVYHVEMRNLTTLIDAVPHDILVYDCVDNYPAFPKYDTQEKKEDITKKEAELASRADIVFATAPGLVDKLTRLNANTHYTPNVGDYERFRLDKAHPHVVPDDLKSISKPIVGFTGAVDDYKLDRELVRKIAGDFPSYSFVIIGPSALKDREATAKELGFEGFSNIYFLGMRPYQQMPDYYAGFDVNIIPYMLNDYTVGGCFPVKFHEALAAGLPVVVTDLPAYRPFKDVCYISKSYNDFSQNIRRALEENNQKKIDERVKVAKENNWEGKVTKMINLIDTTVANL